MRHPRRREALKPTPRVPHPYDEESVEEAALRLLRVGDYAVFSTEELNALAVELILVYQESPTDSPLLLGIGAELRKRLAAASRLRDVQRG